VNAVSDFLAGKVVAVTGGGRGIGRAVAIKAAAEGANVVVADNGVMMDGKEPDGEVPELVVKEIKVAGGQAISVAEDVSTMSGGRHIVQAALDTWGRIDGVVTAAGILRKRVLPEMSEDEWDTVIATHLKGHFTVFRAAAEMMVKRGTGGALVGFTSAGYAGLMDQPNYSAAKGGVVSLVRSAAAGLRDYGITANAIAPGAGTRMMARLLGRIPTGEPDDVAPMAVYLLSDRAKHVTGQVYSVVGSRISVWNQPTEVRTMYAEGRWTPEDLASRLDGSIGQEPLGGTAIWNPADPETAPSKLGS
jgi:NAD(P)-dependent dehydrogenase (short-subunit alcohol dehydrogenase family)